MNDHPANTGCQSALFATSTYRHRFSFWAVRKMHCLSPAGLGALGVNVRVSGPADCWALYSHHCKTDFRIPRGRDSGLSSGPICCWATTCQVAPGHVILPCSDDAIEFLARHEAELRRHYKFDSSSAVQRLALLDKQKTLEMARAAGLATPNSWPIREAADLKTVRAEGRFPLDRETAQHGPLRQGLRLQVLCTVDGSFDQLEARVQEARDRGFEVTVMEMIPGPDTLLSSYYTYIDDNGASLFHFTKAGTAALSGEQRAAAPTIPRTGCPRPPQRGPDVLQGDRLPGSWKH